MIITVYNAKGGAGKTPIATNIALDREYALGTNEQFHVFDGFIPDNRLMAIEMDEEFPAFGDIDVVLDLAGAISKHSHSISSALSQSDLVLVPISSEVKSIVGGIGTIKEIGKFTDRIAVVATKLAKESGEILNPKQDGWEQSRQYQIIKRAVQENTAKGDQIPVFPLKFSKVFDAIFEKEKSIHQLMEADPLAAYNYRDVSGQFDEIYNHIDEMNHAQQKRSLSA